MGEAVEESMVARLAEESTAAMAEHAQSLDITSSQTMFQNRMISLQASDSGHRSEIIGVRVDSERGLIVDQNGLICQV